MDAEVIGRIHVGQGHDLLLCFYGRNALRKHYVTLRENLHIAVRNADVPDNVLVSPFINIYHILSNSRVGVGTGKTAGRIRMRVL